MAIPITDNTTLLRSLKDKANNLPNKGTSVGTDVSGVTATAEDVLAGKVIVNSSGQEVTGTMTDNGAVSQTVTANGDVPIAEGYHNGSGKITVNVEGGTSIPTDGTATEANVLKGKTFYSGGSKKTGTMPTVTLVRPEISIDSTTGKITSTTSTSGSGYIGDALSTNTYNLPTAEGTTITPTTVSQTVVAKNVWTLGASTVAGDTSLIASNIKSGVSIFGVTGTYSGPSTATQYRSRTTTPYIGMPETYASQYSENYCVLLDESICAIDIRFIMIYVEPEASNNITWNTNDAIDYVWFNVSDQTAYVRGHDVNGLSFRYTHDLSLGADRGLYNKSGGYVTLFIPNNYAIFDSYGVIYMG